LLRLNVWFNYKRASNSLFFVSYSISDKTPAPFSCASFSIRAKISFDELDELDDVTAATLSANFDDLSVIFWGCKNAVDVSSEKFACRGGELVRLLKPLPLTLGKELTAIVPY
jgi:hypothetical protein